MIFQGGEILHKNLGWVHLKTNLSTLAQKFKKMSPQLFEQKIDSYFYKNILTYGNI